MDSDSRPYEKEEIIEELLFSIHDRDTTYRQHNTSNGIIYDGKSIAYDVLVHIDGGTDLPAFYLNVLVEGEPIDIAGELHSLIFRSDEELENLESEYPEIPHIQIIFVNKVKALINEFDTGRIGKSDELIARILEIIDMGIDGTTFEMKAISHQEEIDEAIENGENYYPLDGVNIAGNLANRYRQLYLTPKREEKVPDSGER